MKWENKTVHLLKINYMWQGWEKKRERAYTNKQNASVSFRNLKTMDVASL